MLLAAIVGSGVMGERLSAGDEATALLANTLATSAALTALIVAFAPFSGAMFNPAVAFAAAARGSLSPARASAYAIVQLCGAVLGVAAAHVMFSEPVYAWSDRARSGFPQAFSEAIATFGLVTVILTASRDRRGSIPLAVGAYIAAACWFTASTSFANPAVTLARSLTHTFTGIQLADVPGFLLAQAVGTAAATALVRWLDG
jgi:glycerol uptake facilitator-like aquaporin